MEKTKDLFLILTYIFKKNINNYPWSQEEDLALKQIMYFISFPIVNISLEVSKKKEIMIGPKLLKNLIKNLVFQIREHSIRSKKDGKTR